MGVDRSVTVKLDEELRERLQALAKAQDRSPHWLLRKAIEQFVEREEKREALRQDTLKAWEVYQRDGLHATLEEVDAWLARLEAGEDAKAPECHK